MTSFIKILTIFSLALFLSACGSSEKNKTNQEKTTMSATALSKTAPDTFWVDVRTPQEFKSGHLEGAINIPLDVFDKKIEELVPNNNAIVAIYCAKGVRAGKALEKAQLLKYRRSYNAGGYEAILKSRESESAE
jgi:phage shock protein E